MTILADVSLSQPKWIGFLLGTFPTKLGLHGGQWQLKKWTIYMENINKKPKWNLSESFSENEATEFPRFIALKSLEETCLAKFSLFLIEKKIISISVNYSTVKKIRSSNLLIEANNKKHAENLIEMTTFHYLKCKVYPHDRLNPSKGVIRSREFSLVTPEEIKTLRKERIAIRKGGWRNTNTYVHTYIHLINQ